MITVISAVKDQQKFESFLLPSLKKTDAVLSSMNLPKLDLVVTRGDKSIASNYNQGNDRAIFKIRAFVHEDVDLGEPNWVFKVLKTFAENPECGLAGFIGTKKLNDKGMWWDSGRGHILGEVFSGQEKADWVFDPLLFPTEAECVDGFFMAFSEPPVWDESLEGFHFYDLDQSRTIRSLHKKILVVPHKAWHLGKIREPIPDNEWQPYLKKWGLS